MTVPIRQENVHATVVVVGDAGVLLEGRPGAGKSSLALALLADMAAAGRFGRLVADDRAVLCAVHDRLVARPHPAIAGLVERRGAGVLRVAHEAACVVRLVVSLVPSLADLPERCPEAPPCRSLLDVKLPVLSLLTEAGARENSHRVMQAVFKCRSG